MTRRAKRIRFSRWLADLFSAPTRTIGTRRIVVEPLETRELMAVDLGGWGILGDDTGLNTVQGEGEGLNGEGEAAPDLVAFAKALADSGTRFFGAIWCPFCNQQKALFEDGYKYLPFIEVTNPDRTPNQIAIDENITQYPTWEFPDGTRLVGVQTLETLAQRAEITIPTSSSPSMAELPNVNVLIGSPLHVPIDAYDPNGNPLTITVTSSNPSVLSAQVLSGNRSLKLSIANRGDMVFELFEDKAPVPTGRVIALAQSGFYDGITFHRVIDNFVIQGGDPTGTGAGGSNLGDFDDQFNVDLQHNRTGVLSFAKSTDDTNDSQFFITEGPQRFLDFNHSVFGQLVEGEIVREGISGTATNSSDKPINDITIQSATVFTDTENGVIMLKPTGSGTGTSTITVTVTDTEGNSTSRSFVATVTQDTANGAPFLNPIPEVTTSVNTPVNVNLTSQDVEGDTIIYSVQKLGSTDFNVTVNSSTGVATVTPPTGFVGTLQFLATVRQTTTPTTSSPDDNQAVSVVVTQTVPTGVDLSAASDSGVSNTDNITNAQTLTFTVSGTQAGALVEIRSGGSVVGSATASSTTTTVAVNNVAALGQGARQFTATQSIGGQTSGESPALTVTLDSTAPTAVSTAAIPSSVIIDQQLTVDLQHAEEGAGGLSYSLASPPAGMSIVASTGALTWTPTSAQLGSHIFSLITTDKAGNQNSQSITLNVIEAPKVEFELNVVNLSGTPITTVSTGEQFKVQLLVTDLRPGSSATGVFSAYVDLLFDSNIIEPIATNPISHLSPYLTSQTGDTATPGLINELGGSSNDFTPLGSDTRVVAEVTFVSKVAGDPNLRTEAADNSGSAVLVYDENDPVPESRVSFGASDFAVGVNFSVADDVFNFDEDSGSHSLNVLSNDIISGSDSLTIVEIGTATGGGTIAISSGGQSINYTSAANFNGAETFTYVAANQSNVRLTGTVTVQVTDINDPPVAQNDSFSVVGGTTDNVLEVLSNDNSGVDDANSETLTVTSVSAGSNGGAITVGPSGLTIRYTPAASFTGTETFTYTLSDGRGGTDTGTVSVAVSQANPPPVTQNDSFTLQEDAAQASFNVVANDTPHTSGATLTVTSVGSSNNGSTISISSDGTSLLYTPAQNFSGSEIILYTITETGGGTANGLATFSVASVNDPPTAVDDTFEVLSASSSTAIDVLANDTNVDSGETLTITGVTQPASGQGTITIAADGKSLTYTSPGSGFAETVSFSYTIGDGNGLSDTATVQLNVRDFLPRTVSGAVSLYSTAGTNLSGISLNLSGTDYVGTPVTNTVDTAIDGSFQFASLAPGSYVLHRAALPFIQDSGAETAISSAATDGDSVSNMVVNGGLDPRFFDIRDFLGSVSQNRLMVAIGSDGTADWYSAVGDWAQNVTLNITENTAGDGLSVAAVDNAQTSKQGTLAFQGGRVDLVGTQNGSKLYRVRASAGSSLQEVTALSQASTASTLSGEGEAADNSALTGLPTPAIVSAVTSNPNSASENDTDGRLEPSQFRTQLLGSNSGQSVAESTTAVDAAMGSVMPKLQLQLTSDLQDALLDSSDVQEATDQAFGDL
ncbi:MAG: tandem-95 repeat protein [Planctomycetales bacterium]|nr:tandem-95 repeat protein [Planctomycetales bacterium]